MAANAARKKHADASMHRFPNTFVAEVEHVLVPFLAYRKQWPTDEEWSAAGLVSQMRRFERRYGRERVRSHFRLGRAGAPAQRRPIDWAVTLPDGQRLRVPSPDEPYSYLARAPGKGPGEFDRSREYRRVWRASVRAKEYRELNHKLNNDRVLVDDLTLEQWLAVLERWTYSCAWCLRAYEVLDHVVPLSRGGWNSVRNVVPACARCNGARQTESCSWVLALPESARRLEQELGKVGQAREQEHRDFWDQMLQRHRSDTRAAVEAGRLSGGQQ